MDGFIPTYKITKYDLKSETKYYCNYTMCSRFNNLCKHAKTNDCGDGCTETDTHWYGKLLYSDVCYYKRKDD